MDNLEDCCLLKPIPYDANTYIQVCIQCRVKPESVRQPECSAGQYYIINNTSYIRPYGLLIRFLSISEAKAILDKHNFNLNPITRQEDKS
jgi:hypothetical protein